MMTEYKSESDKGKGRVAVIGGGASGMSAAWKLLQGGARVTLYEAEAQLGGHCFSVDVPGTELCVDGGVSDFNEATFIGFNEMLKELRIAYHPICQDASFAWPDGRTCWYVRNGVPHFVEGVREPERLLAEIGRFNRTCTEVLDDVRQNGRTAAEYLAEKGFGVDFERCWFVPRAGGCFPMPERHPRTFLIQSIVEFWKIHGLVGQPPGRRFVLDGGMAAWPDAFAARFAEQGGDLRLSARVLGITRGAQGVCVASCDGTAAHRDDFFDHVVVATNANQVLGLFDDVRHAQSSAFSGLSWQRARVYVHRDASVMPAMREAWGAYNYLLDDEFGGTPVRPTITFWPRALTRDGLMPEELFVSVNPSRVPCDIVASRFLVHPSADRQCQVSTERIERIQGLDRTWYAGAYLQAPYVHEQAVQVGFRAARRVLDTLDSKDKCSSLHAVDFLGRLPDFAHLDKGLFADLVWAMVPFFAETGAAIYRKGAEQSGGAILIESGRVKVINDHHFSITVGANDIIGEMAFLDGGSRTATVIALTDVKGWTLDSARFADLREDPHTRRAASGITHAFARKVASRLLTRLVNVDLHPRIAGPNVMALFGEILPTSLDLRPSLVPAGESLMRRGAAAGACRWLLEGEVAARDAAHQLRFTVGAGGAVGLIEIFLRNPSEIDYVATAPCRTIDVPLEIFEKLSQGTLGGGSRAFAHHYRTLVRWYRESMAAGEESAVPQSAVVR